MNRKTIWIVNQYAGSPKHGMEFRHYYLAHEMVRQGHRVILISGSYSHLYKTPPVVNQTYTFEVIDGIEYCWLKIPVYERSVSLKRILNMFVFVWRMLFLPLKSLGVPDAIIVSSPSLFPVVVVRRWARKFKAKFIFEVRDIWPLTLQELSKISSKHPLILLMRWFEKYGYKKADFVVSLLPNANLHFANSGMDAQKFRYIPNGVDLNELANPAPVSTQFLNQIPQGKFIVGYTGSLGASNAMEYLVEAIQLMREDESVFFVIVGQGDHKESLRKACENCSNVLFLDPVPKQQIQSVLALFDVCFIAMHNSKLYSYGVSLNKMFDYMYSAKPLLVSLNSPNNPAELSEGSLVVSPENPKEIVRGIRELKSMTPEQRKALGEKGKSFVLQHHTYAALCSQYLDLAK